MAALEMIGAMPQTQDTAVRFLQYKHYEISNHLGNVLAVVSDKKVLKDTNSDLVVDEYHPDMVSANDYSPFGVYLYGRTWSAGGYRYGFNGQDKDDELKGSGNSLNFGERVYDSRLGRFLSVDPLTKKYPWYTPYQFAGNTPVQAIDLDGLEEFFVTDYWNSQGVLYKTVITVVGTTNGVTNNTQKIHNSTVRYLPNGDVRAQYNGSRVLSRKDANAIYLADPDGSILETSFFNVQQKADGSTRQSNVGKEGDWLIEVHDPAGNPLNSYKRKSNSMEINHQPNNAPEANSKAELPLDFNAVPKDAYNRKTPAGEDVFGTMDSPAYGDNGITTYQRDSNGNAFTIGIDDRLNQNGPENAKVGTNINAKE